jgi:hypothetical protein
MMSSCNTKLPSELWLKIFLQAKLSLKEVVSVSKVCRQFHRLIFNELFLQKCGFSPVQHDLVLHLNFAHQRNYSENAIPISQGGLQCENASLQRQAIIEANALFGHTLKVDNSKRSSHVTSKFVLNRKVTSSSSFSISFWLLLTDDNESVQSIEFSFEDTPYYSESCDSHTLIFDIAHGGTQIEFECCDSREHHKRILKESSLTIGQWFHFTMVYCHKDKSKAPLLKIYQDGKELYDFKNFKIPLTSEEYFKIYIRGSALMLADIALWSRELMPLELQVIYQQRTSLDKVNLIQSLLAMNQLKDQVSYFLLVLVNMNSFLHSIFRMVWRTIRKWNNPRLNRVLRRDHENLRFLETSFFKPSLNISLFEFFA